MRFLSSWLCCLLLLSALAPVVVAPVVVAQEKPETDVEDDTPHNPKPFGLWLMELREEAKAAGIDVSLLERAFAGVEPNRRIIRLDRKQPEGTKTFTDYLRTAVSDTRISKGRALLREHRALLERVAGDLGVQPHFIVALWGIETNYGGYTGSFSVIEALATLAYDGRRGDFFRKELLKALQILQEGHIELAQMEGSWAGAMGQSQFMPTSFLNFAVDYDKDGRKDIWTTQADVFASIANYLKQSGWDRRYGWGFEVRLPDSLGEELTDGKTYKPLSAWQRLGVRLPDGGNLPVGAQDMAISLPGERAEGAYLVTRNYDVLLDWNRSRYFATAVGLLSDAISQ